MEEGDLVIIKDTGEIGYLKFKSRPFNHGGFIINSLNNVVLESGEIRMLADSNIEKFIRSSEC